MNPAWSFACTHVLPSTSVPYARTNASVSSDVVTDGVSSSSAMTGGGLKKCIPITRSGRPDAMPSSTIGIDEVLEARTTSGLVTSPSVRKISRFASTSSVAASITRSEPVEARQIGHPGHPSKERLGVGRVELAPLDRLADRTLDGGAAAGDQLVGSLDERDTRPGTGDDLHDAGAHQAAAHDTHLPNVSAVPRSFRSSSSLCRAPAYNPRHERSTPARHAGASPWAACSPATG